MKPLTLTLIASLTLSIAISLACNNVQKAPDVAAAALLALAADLGFGLLEKKLQKHH